MDTRQAEKEKNSHQDKEITSSKCCRPKGQPDPNIKYPPMKSNSAQVTYDSEHRMYFFSAPDKNSSVSELENEEHNRMCIIL
ncbi:MAG: hypothetical protein JO131_06665 [Gammaproteobacteria bacterium]|nr:hypothetical protein [Gammaproteobacteria bacterium]